MQDNTELNLISGVVNADATEEVTATGAAEAARKPELHEPEQETERKPEAYDPKPTETAEAERKPEAYDPRQTETAEAERKPEAHDPKPTETTEEATATETGRKPEAYDPRQTVPNFLSDIRPDFWERF